MYYYFSVVALPTEKKTIKPWVDAGGQAGNEHININFNVVCNV